MNSGKRSTEPPASLPRGPHNLDPAVVAASQRARMLEAIVEVVSERGYAAATVADVISLAGVSRRTFYEHFANKEACFLAAFDDGQARLATAIVDAAAKVSDPDERLWAGYGALCETLAAMPALAKAFAVVAPEAGRAAQDRRNAWTEGSIARLQMLYASAHVPDAPPELPDYVARAIVGAVDALMTNHIETVGAESLPVLMPTIVGIARTLMFNPIDPPSD